MLKRVWAKTNTTDTWKTKVEEHEYRDGSKHYSFRDRFGRSFDLTFEEAQTAIKDHGMVEVTDEMRKEGWIA